MGASAELVDSDFELPPRSPGQLFRARFREDKIAMASLVFIGLLILMAVFAPLVVSIAGAPDPDARDTGALDPLFATPTGPSSCRVVPGPGSRCRA